MESKLEYGLSATMLTISAHAGSNGYKGAAAFFGGLGVASAGLTYVTESLEGEPSSTEEINDILE